MFTNIVGICQAEAHLDCLIDGLTQVEGKQILLRLECRRLIQITALARNIFSLPVLVLDLVR